MGQVQTEVFFHSPEPRRRTTGPRLPNKACWEQESAELGHTPPPNFKQAKLSGRGHL